MKASLISFTLILFLSSFLMAQEDDSTSVWDASTFKGLEFRNIGPALMAGRIADIAIHPEDDHTWYVAVGSGGVWKTENNGTTWQTIFDDEESYSIGCVTIDPNNPHTVWIGTGENVGGRHVGYGDGIYVSHDGGASWENKGLKQSEHISKIVVHPTDSRKIWVACQGPLWSKGGERGLYMSEDGGDSWEKVLGNDEWTGVTDLVMDPKHPDVLYAATWDRHRTVAAYMGGGPGSGLHKSIDGGKTWFQLKKGLPKSNMGKIGLAISHQNPDHLYAAIELDLRKGGVYKSEDGGMSWVKQSDAVAGATGPHYYQELYTSPHQYDRLYLVDNRMQISEDGGRTWRRMNEKYKHGDNHAIAFRADDPDYLLVGSDGGLYESYDLAKSWHFIENMPITQFYKIAVDDAEPFYNVYGGTQDNSTEGGPSRTDNAQGIQNSDWRVVLNWDGHQPATEPGKPNIMYGQRQEGTLSRIDLATGEVIDIQPQPEEDEGFERFNWDAPILVSPHSPSTIFFASYRLWKSEDRGDTWTALSEDLTRNENRFELPIMGRQQSWNNAWDLYAMSTYNTITSIAQSPQNEDLIYIGTDDGIIQMTDDHGENWRKIMTESLPGAPERAYVNDIKADLTDETTVYVALSNHKAGDFSPYLYKSTNSGQSWQRINEGLPERHVIWRLVQDHVNPQLLFIGTEFGIFASVDGGENWFELSGNLPTISFRDLAIQRRENDLVCGSFGRSIYILDDYSCLREVDESLLTDKTTLFPVKDTWWYFPRPHLSFNSKKGSQGDAHFVADNPPFGATFTYYLPETIQKSEAKRKKKEKKQNGDIDFPGWEKLAGEMSEIEPYVLMVVKNSGGEVVRRIKGKAKKGFHRIAWDLRHPSPNSITLSKPEELNGRGFMALPGMYNVTMYVVDAEGNSEMIGTKPFEVTPLHETTLKGAELAEVDAFWRRFGDMNQQQSAMNIKLKNVKERMKAIATAYNASDVDEAGIQSEIQALNKALVQLDQEVNGNSAKRLPGEKMKPTIGMRMFAIARGVGQSRYGPTPTHLRQAEIVQQSMDEASAKLRMLDVNSKELARRLLEVGAPWIEGMEMPE